MQVNLMQQGKLQLFPCLLSDKCIPQFLPSLMSVQFIELWTEIARILQELVSFGGDLSLVEISEVLHSDSNATALVADQTVLSCIDFICIVTHNPAKHRIISENETKKGQ